MGPWWFLRGRYREGRTALERGLGFRSELPDELVVSAEIWLGRLALYSGDFGGALEHFGGADELLTWRGPSPLLADSLSDGRPGSGDRQGRQLQIRRGVRIRRAGAGRDVHR